jgi:hypothetical protein
MVRLAIQRVLIVLLVLGMGWAGTAWSAQTDAPVTQTVVLRPARSRELRINFDYNFRNVLPPFENEPALSDKRMARGLIPTVPPTPLLRNITDNELYLKVDHDRDFSKDSLTTYKSRYISSHVRFKSLQVFTEHGDQTGPASIR